MGYRMYQVFFHRGGCNSKCLVLELFNNLCFALCSCPRIVDASLWTPDAGLDKMISLLLQKLHNKVVPEAVDVKVHLTAQPMVFYLLIQL